MATIIGLLGNESHPTDGYYIKQQYIREKGIILLPKITSITLFMGCLSGGGLLRDKNRLSYLLFFSRSSSDGPHSPTAVIPPCWRFKSADLYLCAPATRVSRAE
ncbi:hypothetical protein ACLOJK_016986 [Asimina triloba]